MSAFPYSIMRGRPLPPGTLIDDGGVNFCLLSEHASGVELLLF